MTIDPCVPSMPTENLTTLVICQSIFFVLDESTNLLREIDEQKFKIKAPVERKKIYNFLLCGKKVKQIKQYVTTNTELLESNANSNTATEATAVEEVDSDDDDESISNPSHDSLCKENFKLQLSNTIIKNESSEKHEEQQKHNIQMTKKHRREQRKMYCDYVD